MHYSQTPVFSSPSEELIRKISAMPKVEIHVHLEGATSPELLFKLAARNHVDLPAATLQEWERFYEFKDFNHFIEVYQMSVACMQSPQDFTDMVLDFMRRQAEQHIQYSEVFISTTMHLEHMPGDEILSALQDGVRQGERLYNVQVKFIPDVPKEICIEKQAQDDVLQFALQARDMGIGLGLGIGGKEIGFPSQLFKDVFAEARHQGLHVVAHAGETGDPQYIREVVELLKPERIGHGIHVLEDPALVEQLRASQMPFEVSPQSNYCTRVADLNKPHPIRRMLDEGLFCTVNTDDPSMFATDLSNEYLTLAAQGFTFEELWQLNLNGLQASFLAEERKDEMSKEWAAWLAQS